MSRLVGRELEEALQEVEKLFGIDVERLNWEWKSNRELQVGDKIATRFDKLTGKAQAHVKISAVVRHPRGCIGHSHVTGENSSINGCYDHAGATRVMVG